MGSDQDSVPREDHDCHETIPQIEGELALFNFDPPQNVLEEPLGHRQHATLYDCVLR